MKAYKIIGSIVSSLIAFVLVFVLFATLLVGGLSAVVSEDTVQKLSASLVKDEKVQEVAKEALLKIDLGGSAPLSEESVDALLGSTAVQEGISKIAADTLTASLNGETPNVAETVTEMIEAEPELFDEVLEKVLISEERTYDDLYKSITGIDPATLSPTDPVLPPDLPIDLPEYGASVSDLARSWIASNPEEVNNVIQSYLGEGFTLESLLAGGLALDQVDYAVGEDGALPEPKDGELMVTTASPDGAAPAEKKGLSLLISSISLFVSDTSNPDALIGMLKALMNIAPIVFLLLAVGVLGFLYLLASLLTWSFRTSLIPAGIAGFAGGVLTLVLALLPVQSIVSGLVTIPELVETAIDLVFATLQTQLLIYGLIFIVLGAGLVVTFILTKKKNSEALAA